MEKTMKKKDSAVSPVVGVLLMLVVVLIIAAVVSGFAGGLMGGQEKAPNFAMDTTIKNTGYALTSYILFDVKGGDPLDTSDLRLTTSWTTADGTVGGNTTIPKKATDSTFNSNIGSYQYQSPIGFGKGVTGVAKQSTSGSYTPQQCFGNYTLTAGTTMKNSPTYTSGPGPAYNPVSGYGYPTQWEYSGLAAGDSDGMQAILGYDWNALRPGDIVNVKITHMPSSKIVYDANVYVEG